MPPEQRSGQVGSGEEVLPPRVSSGSGVFEWASSGGETAISSGAESLSGGTENLSDTLEKVQTGVENHPAGSVLSGESQVEEVGSGLVATGEALVPETGALLSSGNLAPLLKLIGSGEIVLNLGEEYEDEGAWWTDDHDGTGIVYSSGEVNPRGLGEYLLRYVKVDSEGQTGNILERKVSVTGMALEPMNSGRPFITTWRTTGANQTITIPGYTGEAYNYTIDWGDGTVQTAQTTPSPSHRYANAGDHQVKIYGAFPYMRCLFYSCSSLKSVDQWGDNEWTSMNYAFSRTPDLKILASDVPNLTRVTDMSWMFYDSANLTGNFSGWDVSNVTNMLGMFYSASSFNQPLDSWNVSKVTNMVWMFNSASSFNQPLDSWNVSKVTDMEGMFRSASSFNQPLDSWNVSKVTNMSYMFNYASSFNQPLNSWNVSNVTNMYGMFH